MRPDGTPSTTLAGVLLSRAALFAALQASLALGLWAFGSTGGWEASTRWWPLVAVGANMVSIVVLRRLFRREGKSFFSFFPRSPETRWKDIATTIAIFVAAAPISLLPGQLLASVLFADPAGPTALVVQPLPAWAWAASLAFPVTIAFAELPTYFGYAMPRVEERLRNPRAAVAICAGFLALQHAALPLVLDPAFMVWRALMFAPLALLLGAVLQWRPRLFPYMIVAHALSDLSVVLMIPVA